MSSKPLELITALGCPLPPRPCAQGSQGPCNQIGIGTVTHGQVSAVMEESTKCHGYQEEGAHTSLEELGKALPTHECLGQYFLFIPAPSKRLHVLIGGCRVSGRRRDLMEAC